MSIGGLSLVSGLHPALQPFLRAALEYFDAVGLEPVLTETSRSCARQDALYAQGRSTPGPRVTNARCGQSAHNYGLAFDVTTRFGYDSLAQKEIQSLLKQMGWQTISWDLPHAEFPNWKRYIR